MSAIALNSFNLLKLSKDQISAIFHDIDTIISDGDGVLWIENNPIQGSVEVINSLKAMGKRVFIITNNSTKIRREFMLKARKMGYDVEEEDIISTAFLAARYLKLNNFKNKVYIIASKGIVTELNALGIRHLGYGPDVLQHSLAQTIEHFGPDPDVGAVIVGFDEHFCYTKLLKAASYLKKPSCLFLATNKDVRFPIHSSLVMPGTGAIVRSVETAARREAMIVGKPYPFIGDILQQLFDISPEKTLIIGDRCDTDISLGTNCGYNTLLVLSGAPNYITNKEKPLNLSYVPNYYINKLGDLLPFLS